MRKLLLSTAVVAAMASVSFAGQAAESATLAVTGTITPATCAVSLSSATIDLGNIAASTLTEPFNNVDGSDVTLNVDCDAAAATAVQVTDNRTASAMTITDISDEMGITMPGITDTGVFGLGTDSAQGKVGALFLAISAATADGTANANLLSSTDKAAWTASTISATKPSRLQKNGYFALPADANATAPAALSKSTYTIASQLMLKKADKYPTGEAVKLDGNVTFSVVYL
ncbi:DUF1120 domain-containing protein [Pantoea agglomerans]|uniref:DUF1120 domain-containing protein n=1 Tax=Enterobacter agglomerans TaxID=549 RepID=UPI0010C1282B|nr:DUF1120 domain-containing protein [Pantoea agglomerans]MBD8182783.1 DUF1120 domain-containing protein [Pantoea agglomerans]MBD8221853.1 DUF1120 domain-containing protein [Pantoea agglomerans]TKJ56884.1 hypothetical protein PagCFBP13505_11655 [Pantoea agglomerans]TKK19640.1 hypothetical protein PagCFBP13516_10245 [Pantoea agglomerans]TKK36370.1 hypothetical protein PagCFBP13532_08815 [Pantoea agglomerans]